MTVRLDRAEALALRMTSLLLRPHPATRPRSVSDVVEWFGAMQSQDAASGLWSLGVRLPGRTRGDVHAALERREALRTWPMRGTVHLVPPRDAHWMLAVTGVRALGGLAARWRQLGLTLTDGDRAGDVLGAALSGGGRLTRAECLAALRTAGLDTAGQRGYHLLWYAAQRGITCIAPQVGNEQTFALLDEWVPDPHRPERDEALAVLAHRYVRGHGPVTRHELARWSGLTVTDATRALTLAGDLLAPVEVDGEPATVDAALLDAPRAPVDDLHVLPGFDEYLLGFKDRSLMLDPAHAAAVVPGNNGMFQATVVRGGRVVGTWKRTLTAKTVTVTVRQLVPFDAPLRARVDAALAGYARFLGLELRHSW
ncbi:winged helix DNA-binding domain-containing protein [Micromonospora sp. WMMD1128]|uniref:winged helix DNA-binding domain-containing protein n=1 Tax=unclassified Micromonospora TaxID=2617518 RepID=UPI00248D1E24|nr:MULTISPECIES: winged helix DNA-binding domain-containing protein [unclassified Micromonospora]WBB75596.1 winged helix DNA-binding domain-containing protein [Micromonospora sp. WMMD1128]WFE31009.1 winged helix DNA-binding domain-containing protein [Micromonospora sp. WMMD975]